MSRPDLNLLTTLDVLLSEGSVARAARRLKLSPSAMSRTLSRLREATGDPLLVRAGRGLVATPRAEELRGRVGDLVIEAETMLRPAGPIDLTLVKRTLTLRTSDGFVENFGVALLDRIGGKAPDIRLRFVSKLDKSTTPLRDGAVDLDTGVIGEETGPELRVQMLFEDRFVGVVRAHHPLCTGVITAARYASGQHILVSRRGDEHGIVDRALEASGNERRITTIVGGFAAALALARGSDLIATVPERHTGDLRANLFTFALPLAAPRITISMMWHPRLDADPAHRWLRQCVREVCRRGD